MYRRSYRTSFRNGGKCGKSKNALRISVRSFKKGEHSCDFGVDSLRTQKSFILNPFPFAFLGEGVGSGKRSNRSGRTKGTCLGVGSTGDL